MSTRQRVKVVICDYEFANVDNEKRVLAELGDIEFIPGKSKNKAQVMELTKDADGVINQYSVLDEQVINNMDRCKVISTYGIGVDRIDVEAATKKGIYVCNVPDYCINEVADHALAMLLALARQLFPLNENTKKCIWGYRHLDKPTYRIEGKTVGLVGFGKISRNLASKLKAFNVKILFYDPYVNEDEFSNFGSEKVELEELIKRSDFISIHVPLTKETKHMIKEEHFKKMKHSLYLINVGRGAVVDESALYKALAEKWIAGAAIDVLENEPIKKDNPLLRLNNVIITPHAAWYSEEALRDLQTKAAEEIVRVLKGENPRSSVNVF